MSIFSLPPLISSLLFLLLGVFVFLKNKKSIVNITFSLICLSTVWWQFSWFILFNIKDEFWATLLVRIGYMGIIFIPITFFHFFEGSDFHFLKNENNFYLKSCVT